MEGRRLDVGQVYGYVVCLVAVLACLSGTVRLAGAILDIRELEYVPSFERGPSLVSFGAYRIDLLSRLGNAAGNGGAAASLIPPDSTLQRMFEAERLHRLARGFQASRRAIVVNLVLLVVATLLLAFHWKWVRARERAAATQGS